MEQVEGMHRAGSIPATAQVCPVGGSTWASTVEALEWYRLANGASRRIKVLLSVVGIVIMVAVVVALAVETVRSGQRQKAYMKSLDTTWEEQGFRTYSKE